MQPNTAYSAGTTKEVSAMLVKEAMTQHVEGVQTRQSVEEAAQMMRGMDTGVLPVMRDGKPVGVITDRDITIRAVSEGRDVSKTRVEECMTQELYTVHPNDDLDTAAKLMAEKQVRRVVVVDSEGKLVGILSLGDLVTHGHDELQAGHVLEKISEPSPMPA